jgi:hypothetical protein
MNSTPTSRTAPDRGDLLFATRDGTPVSRNTSAPAPRDTSSQSVMSELQRPTHDLQPAPVSWLLAGGPDLRSAMDSMDDSLRHTTQRYLALPDADHATSTPSDASPTTRTPTRHGGVCMGCLHHSTRDALCGFTAGCQWSGSSGFLRASWLCSDEPSVDLRAEPGERRHAAVPGTCRAGWQAAVVCA